MEPLAEALREALSAPEEQERKAPHSHSKRVRQLAAEYVRRCREQGITWTALADAVGMKATTLQNWYYGNRHKVAETVTTELGRSTIEEAKGAHNTALIVKPKVSGMKRRLANHRRLAPGVPFKRKLRTEVLTYFRAQLEAGLSSTAAAKSLGLRMKTLRAWSEEEQRPTEAEGATSFVEVAIVPSPEETVRGISVISPGGWRMEGLAISEALQLFPLLS